MALRLCPWLGASALALLAGCPAATNIGDLAPESAAGDTETPSAGTGATPTSDGPPLTTGDEPGTSTSGVLSTTFATDPGSDSGSSDVGDGGDLPPQMSVIAIPYGEIPDVGGGTGTAGGSGHGTSGGLDDETLYVAVGVYTGTCEDPYGNGACSAWRVDFLLDLDQQQPGTYDLELINGTFYEGDPPEDGECGRGNGSLEGSVVIESIDETTIEGELQVSDFAPGGLDLTSFSFTADRC